MVRFIWVKAHAGMKYNEIVDNCAKNSTNKYNLRKYALRQQIDHFIVGIQNFL